MAEQVGKRVAVMQPYFLPYAGYFRLFAAVDEFVVFDCVQFPRRGRVHRTEIPGPAGTTDWLTLPLARQPRDTPIHALRFAADARATLDARLAALPWLAAGQGPLAAETRAMLRAPLADVVGFLEDSLVRVAGQLGFAPAMRRSSSLGIDPQLHGQQRVIAIARAVGATHYLNPSGGRALYDAAAFAAAGLVLEFLTPYRGDHTRMLPALVQATPEALRDDVLCQLRIEAA